MHTCTQEMKAIMQQGVQELPHFDAVMLNGRLGNYEQKVWQHCFHKLRLTCIVPAESADHCSVHG